MFYPCLHQHIDFNPSIIFICIVTIFYKVVPTRGVSTLPKLWGHYSI